MGFPQYLAVITAELRPITGEDRQDSSWTTPISDCSRDKMRACIPVCGSRKASAQESHATHLFRALVIRALTERSEFFPARFRLCDVMSQHTVVFNSH